MSRTRLKRFANIITFDDKTTRTVYREKDNFHTICEFHLFVVYLVRTLAWSKQCNVRMYD